jgi:hypothetical protein
MLACDAITLTHSMPVKTTDTQTTCIMYTVLISVVIDIAPSNKS